VSRAVEGIAQSTHLANAVVVRLAPGVGAGAVARHIERWKHYTVLTTAEEEQILTRTVIEKARRQLGLFTVILLVISTVIVALIIYTLTIDKIREIATLKLIGAPARMMVKLIMQQALALGAIAFAVGGALIHSLHDRFPRRVVLLPADQRQTSTGISLWVRTLVASLPSSGAAMPLPCEAMNHEGPGTSFVPADG
jgi:putative ABC transport system permease protein